MDQISLPPGSGNSQPLRVSFWVIFHRVSPSFIPFLMPWSHKALKEEKKPLEVGKIQFSAGNSGCGEEPVVTANSYFVMDRSRSSGRSFYRDCLEERHGMDIPVNIWGLGTELLWAGGVWRAISNGISACETSLRPEHHPSGVF